MNVETQERADLRLFWESSGGSVPNHWEFKTIEELLEHSKAITVGVMYPGEDTDGGVPLIRVADVKKGMIATQPTFCISLKVDEEYKRTRLNGTELLITLVGNPGDCVIVEKRMMGWNAARAIAVVRLSNIELRPWLRYVLLSKPAQHLIEARLNTTVQKTLNLKDIKELGVPIPPLPEHKSIAKLLSSFDEKKELLREQNETLETLAQTIFKEWFVNFNYPDATGEMVDSEFGEIPKGWAVGSVGDILTLHYGKALKTENRTGIGFPVYGSNGVVGFHEECLVEGPGIIVGRKGTMGAVVWCDNDFFPIDTTFYVKDNMEVGNLYFHYFLLKKQNFERLGSDSAVPGLNRNSVYIIDTVVPAKTCIENFNSIVKPMFEKIENNTSQIQSLTKTRDTLLPKLMSGELRIN